MNRHLPAFIHTLEDKGLLEFNVLGDDGRSFQNRFMIQKYVYLARYFGLNMGYSFGMYLHGPYSSTLANDYYELAESEAIADMYGESIPRDLDLNGLDQSSFFHFVNKRVPEWLEAATTLLSLSQHIINKGRLIERTANMKEHIPEHTIESILGTLERNGLIPSLSS